MESDSALKGDPRVNYVNLIIYDMKAYNFWRMQQYNQNGSILRTTLALDVLLGDMPPHGQAYMKTDMHKIRNGEQSSYRELQEIYEKAMAWLWKHLLSALYNPVGDEAFEQLEREQNAET